MVFASFTYQCQAADQPMKVSGLGYILILFEDGLKRARLLKEGESRVLNEAEKIRDLVAQQPGRYTRRLQQGAWALVQRVHS